MKFYAYADGYAVRAFDEFNADYAAESMAKHVYDSEAGDTPRESYDVTVIDEDGEITRHDVGLEFEPTFSAYDHKEEPEAAAVAELREARGAEVSRG